jgi:hypothetical protein
MKSLLALILIVSIARADDQAELQFLRKAESWRHADEVERAKDRAAGIGRIYGRVLSKPADGLLVTCTAGDFTGTVLVQGEPGAAERGIMGWVKARVTRAGDGAVQLVNGGTKTVPKLTVVGPIPALKDYDKLPDMRAAAK